MPQPSNCLNFLSSYPWKYLKICFVFFTDRRSPTIFKVRHLQYYMEGVLFTVPFTKNIFPPICRTENM